MSLLYRIRQGRHLLSIQRYFEHMKLSRQAMATDELVLTAFKLPKSMLAAIDQAASKVDCAVPNRSQIVREILFKSLNKEAD